MNLFKYFLSMVLMIIFVTNSFTMRTPLSPVNLEISPLQTETVKHDLEALIYREEIMRYEQNRIFFLIKPYIETRLRMG